MAPLLSILYGNVLSDCCFPDYYKSSSIVTNFKNSGEPSDNSISFLFLFVNVQWALICTKIVKLFMLSDLPSEKQNGFSFNLFTHEEKSESDMFRITSTEHVNNEEVLKTWQVE